MQKDKEITSAHYGISDLESEVKRLRTLIDNYASRGQSLPPGLVAQLPKLNALTASLARIKMRIQTGERQKMFIQPVQTAKGKIS